MSSLITLVKNKFLEAISSVNPPSGWKVLVVDEHSHKLLNSVLQELDIIDKNVTLIELITSHRQPQPGLDAMYILMPTSANVDHIISDFSNKPPLYAAAHLFFIDVLSNELGLKLTSSPADPFLRVLKDLYINFWAIEAQAFSLRAPECFFSMYSPVRSDATAGTDRDRLMEDISFVAKSIANVCITLNEFPYIRYYVPADHGPLGALRPRESARPAATAVTAAAHPQSENWFPWRTDLASGEQAQQHEAAGAEVLSRLLAFQVQAALEEYQSTNSDFPIQDSGRKRATLIITDRAMDVVAPFIHEFTYQAMAYDLLPIEDGSKYTYKFQSVDGVSHSKTVVLSDADTVWTEVRHMHMQDASKKLKADFDKLWEDNAGYRGEGATTFNNVQDMGASLLPYRKQKDMFELHLNMAKECMDILERDKLSAVAGVEQDCSTGLTAQRETPTGLFEEMVALLDSREVINSKKVRIIALYIQYRGVSDEDRRRLYDRAELTRSEMNAVNALVHLGVRINRGPADKELKRRIKQKEKQPDKDEYEHSRYKPLIRTVIEEDVDGKLDLTSFPYVKDDPQATSKALPTELRSAKPVWHRPPRPKSETQPRLLLFVAGGMTYSEMREAYLLSSQLGKDIFIGSTHVLTPRNFVDDLKVLGSSGVGSRTLPDGLRELAGKRPYQAFYDERYSTRGAPSPPPQQTQTVLPASSLSVKSSSPTNGTSSGPKKKWWYLFWRSLVFGWRYLRTHAWYSLLSYCRRFFPSFFL